MMALLGENGVLGSMGFGIKRLLRFFLTVGTSRMDCGAHITRYFMYEKLKTTINDPANGTGKRILSISHSETLIRCLGLEKATVVEANYPEYSATNLSAFGSDEFDFVLSDQVLEHVEGNPQDVFDETLRLLKPRGIAVHTSCFINPIHGWPSDFWRFTPNCLSMLAKHFPETIEVGGFGNRATWVLDYLGLRFAPIPHAKWHPLHIMATQNDPMWPVSTWIVLRK
jgi:SAM-dependent methyltransferase